MFEIGAPPKPALGASRKAFVQEGTEANFAQIVMERSLEVPVVVDFWAEWCGPCKTLGPALEKLAEEYGGRFELVKVDVDKNPRLSQAFRIQSIPTVYAFAGGQPVDGFQGALPPAEVKKFIDRLPMPPPPERDLAEIAREASANGEHDLAKSAWEQVLTTKPELKAEAQLALARVALAQKDRAAAESWLGQIAEGASTWEQAQRLKGVLEFYADAGDAPALRAAVQANDADAESWYRLGCTLAVALDHEGALEAFFQVVLNDRKLREDGGRRALVSLFDLLGPSHELTVRYRKRLAATLF
jgi:putative thioredoxin